MKAGDYLLLGNVMFFISGLARFRADEWPFVFSTLGLIVAAFRFGYLATIKIRSLKRHE